MVKAIYFDMDGTIADLYAVDGWLADLRSENVRPYRQHEETGKSSSRFTAHGLHHWGYLMGRKVQHR